MEEAKNRNIFQSISSRDYRKIIPWLLLVAFLSLMTAGIYRKAYRSQTPPLYDAMSYLQKANSVWAEIQAGRPENVFSAEPRLRPPGSVIVTAPFGPVNLLTGYRGFYFRSIAVPIFIWLGACLLLFFQAQRRWEDQWLIATIVGGLACLPMFFRFEWNDALPATFVWGFQDALAAVVAALALALLLRSIPQRRIFIGLLGGLVAAYSVLLKPVGLLVMAAVYGQWAMEMVLEIYFQHRQKSLDRRTLRYTISVGVALPLLFAVIVWICLHTPYLSNEILSSAKAGQAVVIEMFSGALLPAMRAAIAFGIGYFWFAIVLGGLFWSIFRFGRDRKNPASIHYRVPIALVIFGFSLIWWITMAGPLERYLFPFGLCLLLSVITTHWQEILSMSSRWKIGFSSIGMAVICGFCILIYATDTPLWVQKKLGINLTHGGHLEELQVAQKLLSRIKPGDTQVRVFKSDGGNSLGIVESCLIAASSADNRVPDFAFYCPFVWEKKLVLKRRDLINSDFILYHPPAPALITPIKTQVKTFDDEMRVLADWLSRLTAADGVSVITKRDPWLFEIKDPIELERSFQAMVARYQWRPLFLKNNDWHPRYVVKDQFNSGTPLFLWDANTVLDQTVKAGIRWTPQFVRINALIEDSYIIFKPLQLPPKTRAIVQIEVSAPLNTECEIFWKNPDAEFTATQRQTRPVDTGFSEVLFELPTFGENIQLRFDPGYYKGKYLIRKFEVRTVPATEEANQ